MYELRVLHIIPTLGSGGAEKMLVDIVEEMKKKGIHVEVLVLSRQGDFYSEQIKGMGIPLHFGKVDKVYHYSHLHVIRKFMKQGFNIIHTHLFAPQLYVAVAKKITLNKVKLITTEHNTNNRRRENKFFKPLDNWMYGQYDKVIAITEGAKMELNNYLLSTAKKTVVIENGIKLEQYDNALPLQCRYLVDNYKENDVLILMVAAMGGQKDHETVIRASKLLPDDYHIIFVGEGERMSEVQSYAEGYGDSNIHFLGRRSDVASIMKTSDIFVLSSHWEGFGLVAVEAMAAGLPVIASNVTGLSEVVGDAGILFGSENETELATAIEKVIKDTEYRQKLIKMGVQQSRKYSIQQTVEKYIRIYYQM